MAWELILKSREDAFRETATLRLDGAIADIVETLQSMGASRTETKQVFISAMEQLMDKLEDEEHWLDGYVGKKPKLQLVE